MTLKARRTESGIALIIVMVVILVLGILAGGFAYSMKVETKLARNASIDSQLEWLGRSGIELARYVLSVGSRGPGGGQFDALNQKWAGGPGDTNDPLSEIPLENYELGSGTISVKIVDMDRKFNINVADEVILRQALTLVGVDAAEFPTIVDSILDWRDPDDDTHLSGTESNDYMSNPAPGYPPYRAKNGPIDDLSELLMVRGIGENPAVYWGSQGEGRIQLPASQLRARRSALETPIYEIGLVDLFTPMSSRLLNVNTASVKALQIIPEIDENVAHAIITARAGPDGADGTEDDTPFRSVAEMARVPGMHPNAVAQLGRFYTVRSQTFEVKVTARIGSTAREFTAVLGRTSRDIQVLNMYWK